MSSEVYFAQRRATQGGGLLEKLDQLCDAAGFASITTHGDPVAVLAAFGEPGNITYLRPQYLHRVVRKLRQYGARPFLTEALPLPPSRRMTGLDLLICASQNGFDALAREAPLVPGDGMLGRDEVLLPGPGKHLREARIASAIAQSNALISVCHFTGHGLTGFAGAMLNVGYGAASLAGKGQIVAGHGVEGPDGDLDDGAERRRIGNQLAQERLVESLAAIQAAKGRRIAYVNVLVDLTPEWDNQEWSDAAVVPDIGILASRDPVAIDQASMDLFNQSVGIPGTRLTDPFARDKVRDIYPQIDWEHQLRYAASLGLGTRDYELMII